MAAKRASAIAEAEAAVSLRHSAENEAMAVGRAEVRIRMRPFTISLVELATLKAQSPLQP